MRLKGDKMASMDGVISMRLKGDKMASMDVIPAAIQKNLQKLLEGKDLGPPWLLFVSESGHGKCVPLSAFRLSNFNRVGLLGCEAQFKLAIDPMEYARDNIKFGLVEVVYEWQREPHLLIFVSSLTYLKASY